MECTIHYCMNLERTDPFDGDIKVAPNQLVLKARADKVDDLSLWQPSIHTMVPGRRHRINWCMKGLGVLYSTTTLRPSNQSVVPRKLQCAGTKLVTRGGVNGSLIKIILTKNLAYVPIQTQAPLFYKARIMQQLVLHIQGTKQESSGNKLESKQAEHDRNNANISSTDYFGGGKNAAPKQSMVAAEAHFTREHQSIRRGEEVGTEIVDGRLAPKQLTVYHIVQSPTPPTTPMVIETHHRNSQWPNEQQPENCELHNIQNIS